MLRYLLDTSLCIRVLRDRPQGLRARFNANAEALCLSDVVLYDTNCCMGRSDRTTRPASAAR